MENIFVNKENLTNFVSPKFPPMKKSPFLIETLAQVQSGSITAIQAKCNEMLKKPGITPEKIAMFNQNFSDAIEKVNNAITQVSWECEADFYFSQLKNS